MIGLAVALMMIASLLWIEAHERRAALGFVQASAAVRVGLKLLGWAAAGLGFVLIARSIGWERGIPVGLAWFMGVAVLGLIYAARFKGQHLALAWLAVGLAIVSGVVMAFGGTA